MYLNVLKYNKMRKVLIFEVYKHGKLNGENIGIKKSNCVLLC